MKRLEDICRKIAKLNLWKEVVRYNWAVKPSDTVFPYFCSILGDGSLPVPYRFLMLEGWQTFHDFLHTRADNNFGFYSSPMEFSHFEAIILPGDEVRIYRHDPGYAPQVIKGSQLELCRKILWESYGIMMRIESDNNLPMKFADSKSMFARVESPDGSWKDAPLEIPRPRDHVEEISFPKEVASKAKDLPFASEKTWDLSFGMLPTIITNEPRPRCVYELSVKDGTEIVLNERFTLVPEMGLKGLWQNLAPRLMKLFVERGVVPGIVRVRTGREFRMLRPICMELPIKLQLDSING